VPIVDLILHLILGMAVSLLDFAFELFALAFYLDQIVVSELAPLFLALAGELLPVTFDVILLLAALNLGDYRFNRLENLFGEVDMDFADFRQIRGEVREKRLGIFGLDVNDALERLGAAQLFSERDAFFE